MDVSHGGEGRRLIRNKDGVGTPSSANAGGFAGQVKDAPSRGIEYTQDEVYNELDDQQWSKLLKDTRVLTERWCSKRDTDDPETIDDLHMEAFALVLSAAKNKREILQNPGAYFNTVTHHLGAAKFANTAKSSQKGWGPFNRLVAERQQLFGRKLTPAELDEVGNHIRDTWPDQKRKPTNNFWKFPNDRAQLPFDSTDAETRTVLDVRNNANGAGLNTEEEALRRATDAGERQWSEALLYIQSDPAARRDSGRAFRYNAFAELVDSPTAIPGSVSRRRAESIVETVRSSGGASAVIARWEDTGTEDEVTEAFFAPFGDLDYAGKRDVCRALTQQTGAEDLLWQSAVAAANQRNLRRIQEQFEQMSS